MEPTAPRVEQDLFNLIGVAESFRLEFKSARLLLHKDKAVPELSRTVSAFANSEGGTIVLGITERVVEGNRRIAEAVDGIERHLVSPEWLQQVIGSHISPALPGIRVQEIALTGERSGRVAFVVVVPAGSTAYQADDRRYYGRQEFGVEPLPDHEVRLRMARGRIPRLNLEPDDPRVVTASHEYGERQLELGRRSTTEGEWEFISPERLEVLKAPPRTFDEYSCHLLAQNVGDITIRDFMLSLEWVLSPEVVLSPQADTRFRFARGGTRYTHLSREYEPPPAKLFPGERTQFPGPRFVFGLPESRRLSEVQLLLRWTAFLDDAPPSSGEIDIAAWFSRAIP